MIIKEVPAEGNLTIEVSLKERKLEFHSQCVESGVNYIYAQPIRIDGKILSFNSEGHLMVNLIYLREEKNPIVWKGVGITTVQNNGKNVSADQTDEDGHQFKEALGKDGYADDDKQNENSDPPVFLGHIDTGRSQCKTDDDDDRSCYNRRKEVFHSFDADKLDDKGQHTVNKTGGNDSALGGLNAGDVVVAFAVAGDNHLQSSDVGKAGADKYGHPVPGAEMENQSADTGADQGHRGVEAGEGGNQHSCAKHGE